MSRPISKAQFSDLWWDEFCADKSDGAAAGCMICGGSGLLNTRGKVFNALGEDVGGQAFCICPTGRHKKVLWHKARKEEAARSGN